MGLFTSVVVGGLIGWLARMLAVGRAVQNMLVSVLVGAIGALLSGWLISPLVGISTDQQDGFSIMAVVVAIVGALILLGVVDFAWRRTAR